MRTSPAFEVTSLTKRYEVPDVLANDDITFAVASGESFGLLGPNGAGKSTLVKQLVGLLRPTSGSISLFGEKLGASSEDQRRLARTIAYLPQGTLSLGELKVAEAIRWTGMLRGLGETPARSETDDLLECLQLQGIAERQLRKLSGGQRRLVQLGMTFVGRLPILILDEPTTDIDVSLRQVIWGLIADRCAAGTTVILVTHDVAEAEQALSRVAILDRGRVVTSGSPAELKADLAHRTRLEIVVRDGGTITADQIARDLPGEHRIRGRHLSAWVPADEAIRNLEKIMGIAGPEGLEDVRLITPTLEDVYLELGGRSIEEAESSEAAGSNEATS